MAQGELKRYREIALLNSSGTPVYTTTVVGAKAKYAPGLHPVIIRGLTVQNYTTVAFVGAPVITFFLNTTPGLTATTAYTVIDTITLTTASAGDTGQVFYATPTPTVCRPGEEVVLDVTTITSGAHYIRGTIYVEPGYEIPSANSNMTESA
jgi:hypothetical protein